MKTVNYKTLTQEEKDDIIVSFLHQQEIDHLCHTINKQRYEKIINDPEIVDSKFKDRIRQLKLEIELRLFEVEKIIEHTQFQLPSEERIKSASKRIKDSMKNTNKKD